MPIPVKCECGHEISVADSMEGRKGRCPECDAVLEVPATGDRSVRSRGGAFTPLPRSDEEAGYRSLSLFASVLSLLSVVALLGFAFVGVFTGFTAFKGGGSFRGPLGLFEDCAPAAREQPMLVGIGFIVGGLVVGGLAALVLAATSQCFRLFISLDKSLKTLAERTPPGAP